MFDIKDVKSFMDSVHGYIRIPKLFVEHIIDTCEFQRLRNVDQTGMKILYPAAKHDRFIHSLGVYHLGCIAVDALLENFKENPHWKIRSNNDRYIYWAKNKVLFLIACLLHDIGHAPFSHSLETFYDFKSDEYPLDKYASGEEISGCLEDRLIAMLSLDDIEDAIEAKAIKNDAAQHERMGAYLILHPGGPWRNRIKSILDGLEKMKFPESVEPTVGEYDKPFPTVDSTEIDDDLRFIARMIMGVKYTEYLPEKQIRNCFIELLNGSIDVDKLDYIMRDTKMSGINNITLDTERLLGSLSIILTTVYKDYTFGDEAPRYKDTIIRTLDVEKNNIVKIYGKIDRALSISDGMISVPSNTVITLKRKKSNATRFLHCESTAFTPDSLVRIGSTYESPKEQVPFILVDKGERDIELENATVADAPGSHEFKFSISSETGEKSQGGYQLWINEVNKEEDQAVILNAKVVLNTSRFTGMIRGQVKYMEVLSDDLSERELLPTKNCYTGYSLGFKKQAVNLISNVFDARNYLYLWIYSHHKVIYYANYLIIELARLAMPVVGQGNLNSMLTKSIVDNDESYLLDEGNIHHYIRSGYKAYTLGCSKKDDPARVEYIKLFHELISRKYRRSLYKSLAEYDLLFEKYNLFDKKKILEWLESISLPPVNAGPGTSVGSLKYGYINPDVLAKMKYDGYCLSDIIEDLVWIGSKPSIKRPDPSQIILAFKGENMVVSMDRLPILNAGASNIEQDHYFYLYYREKQNSPVRDIKAATKKAFFSYLDAFLGSSQRS